MYGQVSTGQEQEFDYGIKNNSTQTVTTPTYLGTVGADGTYGKMNRNNVIEYLEFASAVNLPVTGEQGKLYLTKDNNKIYRWNGTFYQELAVTDISGLQAQIDLKAPISSVHNPVTLGTANGLSLSTQQLSLGLASSGVTGALSGTDWNTLNNKQDALGYTPENAGEILKEICK